MFFTDQLKRIVSLPSCPQRIISLVPSQTELLVDLGLEENLVGVTKFCVHPAELRRTKTIVGGTKNYRMNVIDSLKPDLIIGNKEENEQLGIEELMQKYPVWMSDIDTLKDSLDMIESFGKMLGAEKAAQELVIRLNSDFASPFPKKGTAIYLIWKDPIMVAGVDTFINEMLDFAGYENLILDSRYPQLSEKQLIAMNPENLLLSSEPFPFKEVHLTYFRSLLPEAKIKLVDGEIFSWYGSRLLQAKVYCENL